MKGGENENQNKMTAQAGIRAIIKRKFNEDPGLRETPTRNPKPGPPAGKPPPPPGKPKPGPPPGKPGTEGKLPDGWTKYVHEGQVWYYPTEAGPTGNM